MNKFDTLFENMMAERSVERFTFKKKDARALNDMKKNADKVKKLRFNVPYANSKEPFPADEIDDWTENQDYATIEDWAAVEVTRSVWFDFHEYKDQPVKNKIEFGKAFLEEFPIFEPSEYENG